MQGGKRAGAGRTTLPSDERKEGHKIYISSSTKELILQYGTGTTFSEKCCFIIESYLSQSVKEPSTQSALKNMPVPSNAAEIIPFEKSQESIHSPFRYAGGKYYARKLITQHIPPHDSYCELFAGGASIFFEKNKVKYNLLNDKDKQLMLVLRTIRDFPNDLVEFLRPYPASKELHGYFKNEFKPNNELEIAGRWYYLNRTSYSGIMNMPNCYWGYGEKFSMQPHNWPRTIQKASEKLQDVVLLDLDFEDAISRLKKDTFLFVDPPYYNADQDKFYTEAFKLEDHIRLSEVLRKNSKRFKLFITYDNCQEVRDLYSWAKHHYDQEWNYCISRTDDQKNGTDTKGTRSKGQEIFILNY